ncbi:MAG: hypothetical protein ABIG44_11345 [Planctomycetota bacterium]
MNREDFEKLVSDWLDEPHSIELRTRLDSALASDSRLAQLRDELARVDSLIRTGLRVIPPVAWERLKARICKVIERLGSIPDMDARLDQQLRALPGVQAHVDWNAFQRKISRALDRESTQPSIIRLGGWRGRVAAGVLAAAAALVLMFTWPTSVTPPAESTRVTGLVTIELLPPTDGPSRSETSASIAQLDIVVDEPLAPPLARSSSDPEVFFMLEPPNLSLVIATGGYVSP